MATSGSVNFSTSRDELIKYALMGIGAIGQGETPTATQVTDAAFHLNLIVKTLQADGMPLWALKQGYVFPIAETNQVLLGPSGGKAATSYTQTTVTSNLGSGTTVIPVDSAAGISATDNIGIEQDDGTVHWTTVSFISGSNITIAAALTAEAASGSIVWSYPTSAQITRPLRIIHAYTYDVTNDSSQPMRLVSSTDYFDLGSVTSKGRPTQFAYSPQLTNGIFRFYPRFQNGDILIVIYYHRPFEDFDASTDEPDFPQEWYSVLLWKLMYALSPGYGIPLSERESIRYEAERLHEKVLGFGMEEGSVYFQPDFE